MSARVSIIICTRNRAEDLRQTLTALSQICVPEDLPTELVIADNGSTDGTADLVRNYHLPNMTIRYVHEPRPGKGYVYNRGMAEATGEVFLLTDDDVRPAENWIAAMCRPILEGRAEAVFGKVVLPDHLNPAWTEPMHRTLLASTEETNLADPDALVGANMAFSRKVLELVPAFDTELGPGAIGFGDETLFSYQLKEAGYKIVAAPETQVEHHFDSARLTRDSFLSRAAGQGRSDAYITYHWRHEPLPKARFEIVRQSLRLRYWRFKCRANYKPAQGPPVWEMIMVYYIALNKQFLAEQRRPRKYDRHGLVKRVDP